MGEMKKEMKRRENGVGRLVFLCWGGFVCVFYGVMLRVYDVLSRKIKEDMQKHSMIVCHIVFFLLALHTRTR